MYRKSLRSGESTNRLIGESNSCCLVVESLSRLVDSVSRIRSLSLSKCPNDDLSLATCFGRDEKYSSVAMWCDA